MKYLFFLILMCCHISFSLAQDLSLAVDKSEVYRDAYKFSRILAIEDDGKGGTVIVRSYFGGMIMKQKGFYVEHYNNKMQLVSDFEYDAPETDVVGVLVAKDTLRFVELKYHKKKKSYQFIAHQSPLDRYKFTKKQLVSVGSKEVDEPFDRSFYKRNFSNNFTSSVLFARDKSAFCIDLNYKKDREDYHRTVVFSNDLTKLIDYTTNTNMEKHYALESMLLSKDQSAVFLVGKSYFKQKKYRKNNRAYQYELLRITNDGIKTQDFAVENKYIEALQPVFVKEKLVCVGMFANRRGNRQNGLSYFQLKADDLSLLKQNDLNFTQQFMMDKFGRTEDNEVKNLVFKDIHVSDTGAIVFNAEEYFLTSYYQSSPSGAGRMVYRHHYNDIVCMKLNAEGNLLWARNINKTEVREGDEAYASYTSYLKGGDTYFFINSGEYPQQMSKQRLLFRESYSRTPNLFAIKIDGNGTMSYGKIVDDKELRVPVMVSKALVQQELEQVQFLAKRGTKKILLKAHLN